MGEFNIRINVIIIRWNGEIDCKINTRANIVYKEESINILLIWIVV